MPAPETNLQRRVLDVRANIAEHVEGPLGEEAFAAIICEGCGRVERADNAAELEAIIVPAGWAISDGQPSVPDLCPRCVTALNAIYARSQAKEALGRLASVARRLTRRETPSA